MYLGVISTILFLAAAVFTVNAEAQDSTNQKCGIQSTVNSYPWLVALNYSKIERNEIDNYIGCSGVLISEKHVVIPAHCLSHPKASVHSVVLGPLDLICHSSSTNPDCMDADTIRAPIGKIVKHPKHAPGKPPLRIALYDIALVTLRDAVPYTDAIRPVCLPSTDVTQAASTDLKLQVTGLRRLFPDGKFTSTHEQLTHRENINLFNREECQKQINVEVPEDQVCTDNKDGVISCMMSGAPLMNKRGDSYELIGLMNRGRHGCGVESQPPSELYTNVFYNLNWLSSEMAK